MIVRNGTGFLQAVQLFLVRNWRAMLLLLLIESLSLELHLRLPALSTTAFSEVGVGMLAATVGVFLAFRFSEAYGRWWEARTLWGGMVNTSRTLGRQITTYVAPEHLSDAGRAIDISELRRELVYRHIAYLNALRLSLRKQEILPEIEPFLSESEASDLRTAQNVPVQLAQRQGERLVEVLGHGVEQQIVMSRFDGSLTSLLDHQGGMERIKNTAFPDRVLVVTRVLVWVVAGLVALAFIDPDEVAYFFEFVAVLVIMLSFKLLNQLGEELNDPFENQPNDTPMTALCRTIEIDLRQQLRETDLPDPIEPERGVLM